MYDSTIESPKSLTTIKIVSGGRSFPYMGKKSNSIVIEFPPNSFVQTIRNEEVANSEIFCFVIYCMNNVRLDLRTSNECFCPFELFKDCYSKAKIYGSKPQLQKYFNISNIYKPLDEDTNESYDATAVSLCKIEGDVSSPSIEMSIFPQILQFNNIKGKLETLKHIEAYKDRFEAILRKFNSKQLPHLYINWLKLIESYVELVFRDLTIKWKQWLHSIRAAGRRHSIRTALRTLLPRICKRFWKHYFVFQHSTRHSIGDLSSDMLHRNSSWTLQFPKEAMSRVTFGVWLDSTNGILLFGNGVVFFNSDNALESSHVAPTSGVCLDQISPEAVTQKLLLFINLAIVECFMNEIA